MKTIESVLDLLDLKSLGLDRFEGSQPGDGSKRVFGGQAAAQALMAACTTVEDRLPHSLHVYFVSAGDTQLPIEFGVDRVRDGRRYSTRTVTASQQGRVILTGMVSFGESTDGDCYHDDPGVVVSQPEALQPIERQLAAYVDEYDGWWTRDRPFDLRYTTPPPRVALDVPDAPDPSSSVWLRANGSLTVDEVTSRCLVTYVSDMTLLDSAAKMTRQTSRGPGTIASLDHAVWFHRTPDLSQWHLYEQHSPVRSSGRSLVRGRIVDTNWNPVCTVTQEGLLEP